MYLSLIEKKWSPSCAVIDSTLVQDIKSNTPHIFTNYSNGLHSRFGVSTIL